MAETIRRMEQAGAGWHVPLLRAAMAGDLRFCILQPGQRLPLSQLDMQRHPRPFAVILGGDAGGPAGPDAFPQARRLLRWAAGIVLHGAGGEARHYGAVAEAAMLLRRVALVETTTAALPQWLALKAEVAPATPALVVEVPPGKPAHPTMTAPAGAVIQ